MLEEHLLDQDFKDAILQDAQDAIQFHVEHEENYEHVGNSRIAGYPDLPPTIEWPCNSDGEYYTFIAQINVSELPFSPYEGFPNQVYIRCWSSMRHRRRSYLNFKSPSSFS
ncbi:hypothetical protein ASL14_10690 [Paenibacillus sp. IHB B 3084]|nr:hypothetical protein ASL14_10690 [Paenibacillus sp. IHB B 3084]